MWWEVKILMRTFSHQRSTEEEQCVWQKSLQAKQTMLDLVLRRSQMSALGLCTATRWGVQGFQPNICLLQRHWRGLLFLGYIYILFEKRVPLFKKNNVYVYVYVGVYIKDHWTLIHAPQNCSFAQVIFLPGDTQYGKETLWWGT